MRLFNFNLSDPCLSEPDLSDQDSTSLDSSSSDSPVLNSLVPSSLWLEKQSYLIELYKLSHASILDDPSARDRFEQQMVKFIYDHDFDAINGGIILQTPICQPPLNAKEQQNPQTDSVNNLAATAASKKKYHKSLAINIILTEILACTDRVLYNGLFSITASRQLNFLFNHLFDQVPAVQNELSCYFSLDALSQLLEANELALIEALTAENADTLENADSPENVDTLDKLASKEKVTDKESIITGEKFKKSNKKGLLVCYHRSLSEAADSINMPYKQAQIIEFQALQKLSHHLSGTNKNLNAESPPTVTNYFANNAEENHADKTNGLCWLALTLIRQLTIESSPPLLKQLESLMSELDLIRDQSLNRPDTGCKFAEQLHLLHTRLAEYQLTTSKVNFEQILVDIEQLPSSLTPDQVAFYQQQLPQLSYQLLVLNRFLNASIEHFQYFSCRITQASDHISKLTLIIDDDRGEQTGDDSSLSADTETPIMKQLEPLVEVIFLPRQQALLQQQKMKLQSKFNPFQYVFEVE